MVLLIWFAVTDGLRPRRRLARYIELRSAEHLTPVDEPAAPSTIRPLTNALDGLIGKLGQALSAQRRFTAGASHALRTPLAAIRTHAHFAPAADEP